MSAIRFGVQTYSWLMAGETHKQRLSHIIDVGARAGFDGLEAEVVMLGPLSDPSALGAKLAASNLALAAICLVQDWAGAHESPEERREADRIIELVARFPGTKLVLCQTPGRDRARLDERQRNLFACVNAIAARALARGVPCTYHPNSPPGSVIRTADDYERLLASLDPRVGLAADVGHIAAGGMDPLATVKRHRARIDHLHFKDMRRDGRWATMGAGGIDFPGIVRFLHETRYDGWIMVEDEGPEAERDPDDATLQNGRYVTQRLRPLGAG